MDFRGTTNISISLWVNINTSTGFGNAYSLFNAPGSFRSTYGIDKLSSGGFRFLLDLGGTVVLEWDRNADHGRYPTANQWYHVVGTYNGSDMIVYIDGVLDNSREASGEINAVGVNYVYLGPIMSGKLDEVVLFNKSITQEEVLKLYNLGE